MSATANAANAIIESAVREIYKSNIDTWFRRYAVLRDKQGVEHRYNPVTKSGGPVPTVVQQKMFAVYTAQRKAKQPIKMIVLKPRQNGASTAAQAIMFYHLRSFPGRKGALMADISGTADKVYEHFRTFASQDEFDWGDGLGRLKQENNLTDDITLPGGSLYLKVSANSNNAGRGGTVQCCNLTEVSFYPPNPDRDPALAFLGSWNKDGESSVCIMDSTPFGFGTFYQYWTNKRSGFTHIFVAWFEEPSYACPFDDDAEMREFKNSLDVDEREEMEKFPVSLEQMKWRRKTINDSCGGDPDKFRQEYPSDDVSCFLRKTRTRFSIAVLENMERRASVQAPQIGSLSDNDGRVTFYPDSGGAIKVWEQPRYGCRYIVGFDSCTGRDQQSSAKTTDADSHSIKVWRDGYVEPNGKHWPPKLCAKHASQLETETATLYAAWLSRWYGTCITVPEVNGCGLYPTKKLIELGIPVFYRKSTNSQTKHLDGQAGWRTDENTRRELVDFIAALIAKWTPENPTFENWDLESIEQYKKFVINKTGRPEAMAGHHDDEVFGDMLALYNLPLASMMKEPKSPKVNFEKLMRQQGWRLQSAYQPQE